jgi:hypothetical protein
MIGITQSRAEEVEMTSDGSVVRIPLASKTTLLVYDHTDPA